MKSFLILILALVLGLFGCSPVMDESSAERSVLKQTGTTLSDTAGQSQAGGDNTDEYWGEDSYPKYEPFIPEKDNLVYWQEVADEKSKGSIELYQLDDLLSANTYMAVWKKDNTDLAQRYFANAVIYLKKGLAASALYKEVGGYRVEASDLAYSLLLLLEHYPEQSELKQYIPKIEQAFALECKNNRFYYWRQYGDNKSWYSVWSEGASFAPDFLAMALLAKHAGNHSSKQTWELRYADFQLHSRSYDGVSTQSKPQGSHLIYSHYNFKGLACEAAALRGDQLLEAYLFGVRLEDDSIDRSPGNEYDCQQAFYWYQKSQVPDTQKYMRDRASEMLVELQKHIAKVESNGDVPNQVLIEDRDRIDGLLRQTNFCSKSG